MSMTEISRLDSVAMEIGDRADMRYLKLFATTADKQVRKA